MNFRMGTVFFSALALWFGANFAGAADFFEIKKINFMEDPPRNGKGVQTFVEKKDPVTNKLVKQTVFKPALEVDVTVRERIQSVGLTAKAYFYDKKGVLLETLLKPSTVLRGSENHALPLFFEKGDREKLYFNIPDKLVGAKWTALVVFGDKVEAVAGYYPGVLPGITLDYKEKVLVEKKGDEKVERKEAIDPLVEEVVKTDNPAQPQITMFMRPPKGVNQAKDVKGVVAVCLLADNVEAIRLYMMGQGKEGDVKDRSMIAFADENKLAIIAWGSRRAWVLKGSYFEFDDKQNKFVDQSFDEVAKSWERGVKGFISKYGIPDRDYLLWSYSGAANWAHRLALRKPKYFAAAHMEILSTYDQPTPEAKNIMWLFTTGEREGGYESSKRFYKDARALGYPILYKAYPGIGHQGCWSATMLGQQFFKFALGQIEATKNMEIGPFDKKDEVIYAKRMEAFKNAPWFGDIVNQEMFPPHEIDMIPEGFRVALPTQALADSWKKQ